MKKVLLMTMVLALALTGSAAVAEESTNQAATTDSGSTATVASTSMAPAGSAGGGTDSKWRFMITPISVWGFNTSGSMTVAGVNKNINASFSDITDDLSTAGGLGVEIGKGNWSGYLNASIVGWSEDFDNYDPNPSNPNNPTGDLEFTLDFTSIEAGFAYRLPMAAGSKAPIVELTAGARFTQIEVGLEGTSGFSFDRDENISWTDPMVGMKMALPLFAGFNAIIRTDVGGFGFTDNQTQMTWDFTGGIAYNFKFDGWGIAVAGGYKINHIDYAKHEDPQRFALNMRMQGPFVSASVWF